ncbi:hypothetical protein [Nitrobacter hamburgensis]|uniref:hypothetical protein n=1 Tax=Nitrobacter hamburgensis TaxID=912 RepID=UPI0002E35B1A|nr:hypothetical protein [Nitrobacter hamburgensis]
MAAGKFKSNFRQAEQCPAFQAMQRDGAINLVRLDIYAGVNDKAYDFEGFRFDDGGCPRILQIRAQWREVKNFSGAGVVNGHCCHLPLHYEQVAVLAALLALYVGAQFG